MCGPLVWETSIRFPDLAAITSHGQSLIKGLVALEPNIGMQTQGILAVLTDDIMTQYLGSGFVTTYLNTQSFA